jgi:hypothetical protein
MVPHIFDSNCRLFSTHSSDKGKLDSGVIGVCVYQEPSGFTFQN